ncbi:hypothetical protein T439DRAFT_64144 [Meredithblackwellia eburnea MCA 4105]
MMLSVIDIPPPTSRLRPESSLIPDAVQQQVAYAVRHLTTYSSSLDRIVMPSYCLPRTDVGSAPKHSPLSRWGMELCKNPGKHLTICLGIDDDPANIYTRVQSMFNGMFLYTKQGQPGVPTFPEIIFRAPREFELYPYFAETFSKHLSTFSKEHFKRDKQARCRFDLRAFEPATAFQEAISEASKDISPPRKLFDLSILKPSVVVKNKSR